MRLMMVIMENSLLWSWCDPVCLQLRVIFNVLDLRSVLINFKLFPHGITERLMSIKHEFDFCWFFLFCAALQMESSVYFWQMSDLSRAISFICTNPIFVLISLITTFMIIIIVIIMIPIMIVIIVIIMILIMMIIIINIMIIIMIVIIMIPMMTQH